MISSETIASRWPRFFAGCIDFLAVPLFGLIVLLVTGILEHAEDYSSICGIVIRALSVGVSAYLILNGWFLYRYGQSLGKRLLRIKIVDSRSGKKASFWKLILIRIWFFPLLYLVFLFPVTLVPVLDQLFVFSKSRRCLHDWLCATTVVRV